jgi:hypothetical protein
MPLTAGVRSIHSPSRPATFSSCHVSTRGASKTSMESLALTLVGAS